MKYIYGNICDISSGTIIQQVNCKNAYGAGLSGQISKRWPAVEQDYRKSFTEQNANQLYGSYRAVNPAPNITVINSYTQFNYGNSAKTHIVYTNMDMLVKVIRKVAGKYENVYIPYRLGCGLAGGNWDELVKQIDDLPITVVKYQ